jgi:hypothetical protein
VQVHYDEGVAIRIGPEPCTGTGDGAGEASVGEHTGQPLSRESKKVPGPDPAIHRRTCLDRSPGQGPAMTLRGRGPNHTDRRGEAYVRAYGVRPEDDDAWASPPNISIWTARL